MFLVDQYAYTNKLKAVHPMEKALFSLLTMAVAIATNRFDIHLLIIAIMTVFTVIIAKIPMKFYIRLLLLPLVFILIGVLPIILSISNSEVGFIYSMRLINSHFGITIHGLELGIIACSRSLATISCLYFMSLTTSMHDLIQLLKKMKLPITIIEIMSLIYRFIFVLIESSIEIFNSQSARLGYSSLSASFKSMGKLVSMVFIKAACHSQALYQSLIARGYTGSLNVLTSEYRLNKGNIVAICLIEAALITLAFFIGGN